MIFAPTEPMLSILPRYVPLPEMGTIPTVDPVNTKKFLFKESLSFFSLLRTNFNEFKGFM
jgi:hypothetical protein